MRDLLILGGISVTAIVIGVLLFIFGPSSPVPSGIQEDAGGSIQTAQASGSAVVPFTVVVEGNKAHSITDRTNYRITTRADLVALWALIYGTDSSTPVPSIDFSKYEVLALFDGTHSTSGYSIQAESITDANAVRTVMIRHAFPGSSCTVSSGNTSPFELIQVPKTTFSLAHKDDMATSTCAK